MPLEICFKEIDKQHHISSGMFFTSRRGGVGQKTNFSGAGQGLKSARRYGQWSNPPGAGHRERKARLESVSVNVFLNKFLGLLSLFFVAFFGEKCCFFLLENTAQNVLAPKIF